MDDLKVSLGVLKGDEKARAELLTFVRHLDQTNKGARISPLMRSIRGRFENALPAIERFAFKNGYEEGYRDGYEAGHVCGFKDGLAGCAWPAWAWHLQAEIDEVNV